MYTFIIISRSILLRMRNISDKTRTEKNTHIVCLATFFKKSRRLRDNVRKYGRSRGATDGDRTWRMRFALVDN